MDSQAQSKNLKDLLREEQEPFVNLQLNKKPKQYASFPSQFCKNACFSCTTSNSPHLLTKSPLVSPVPGARSPSHALFLNVPSKTAALLFESAMRIHQNSSSISNPKLKSKFRFKNPGLALLAPLIKRLTNTCKLKTPKTGDDVIRWEESVKSSSQQILHIRVGSDSGSNLATSSSNTKDGEKSSNGDEDFTFCLSPLTTFRFALHTSPSPDRQSPEFSSPANSPSRRIFQDNVKYEPPKKSQLEDEEKEQSSPVSILESPFEDDDYLDEEAKCPDDEYEFNIESSYTFLQRSKELLFHKLRKFKELAGLDPIELEKKMVEDQDVVECLVSDNEQDDDVSTCPEKDDNQSNIEGYFVDITRNSKVAQQLPKAGMKSLLTDLISEEERSSVDDYECVVKRVCNRLECWKGVDSSTIDMIVSLDLKGESDEWERSREDISSTAKAIEFLLFMFLVDELADDLLSLP